MNGRLGPARWLATSTEEVLLHVKFPPVVQRHRHHIRRQSVGVLAFASFSNARAVPIKVVDSNLRNLVLSQHGKEFDPQERLSTIQHSELRPNRRNQKGHLS